ncbi:tetratricopeptide repeat protein [Algiphilus sp.]|uniref:tetratricopeptide repeat protein n=1 Tax=Algiphilus sp. TaxID=1872431 RepID=UPI0025BA8167|nr:tetratricopeptide repeat protein [Algiphilus sp.]MCK5768858.1 hypothetical protein [Algiphilus sp.]
MPSIPNPRVLIILLALLSASATATAIAPEEIAQLQSDWARAQYVVPEAERESALEALADRSSDVLARHPDVPEARIWRAIILSTHAAAAGGLSALGEVREARELLLSAREIDPDAMDGAIPASLGSLYANVPGWPLSFGDRDKADAHLQEALRINPDSIDAHYFYGQLLRDRKRFAEARQHFQASIDAPARPGRSIADEGRRAEARDALAALDEH